jgi:hypothetical protein
VPGEAGEVSRRRVRHSRAALAWALLVFTGIQAALAVAVESWLPALRDRQLAPRLARLRHVLAEDPGRPLVLMLGSSRTLAGFRADRLHGTPGPDGRPLAAFNFGLVLGGPLREWVTLQRLLDEGVRPRLLLVEVLPFFLNEPGPGRCCEENWIEPERYRAADMGRLLPYCDAPAPLAGQWLASRVLPCRALRKDVLQLLARSWIEPGPKVPSRKLIDRLGWMDQRTREAPVRQRLTWTGDAFAEFGAHLADFRLGAGPCRALRDLLGRCRHDGIRAALVLMPEGAWFRSWYPPHAEPLVHDFLAGLQKESGVELIDARGWVPDMLFWDSHHLANDGATLFTERLAGEVRRLLATTCDAPAMQVASAP